MRDLDVENEQSNIPVGLSIGTTKEDKEVYREWEVPKRLVVL